MACCKALVGLLLSALVMMAMAEQSASFPYCLASSAAASSLSSPLPATALQATNTPKSLPSHATCAAAPLQASCRARAPATSREASWCWTLALCCALWAAIRDRRWVARQTAQTHVAARLAAVAGPTATKREAAARDASSSPRPTRHVRLAWARGWARAPPLPVPSH